jgi:hypothetical protein
MCINVQGITEYIHCLQQVHSHFWPKLFSGINGSYELKILHQKEWRGFSGTVLAVVWRHLCQIPRVTTALKFLFSNRLLWKDCLEPIYYPLLQSVW